MAPFLFLLLSIIKVGHVLGHGRLMNPPSRNAMWRLGYPNPINYNDHELYCGGFGVQWSPAVGGKCGPCGDPWTEKSPRKHESGGKFDNGLIGRRYKSGQIVDVEIELTANHRGYFELHLCPMNDGLKIERQECFDKYPLHLEGTKNSRYQVVKDAYRSRKVAGGYELFTYKVKLPDGVTCAKCVIQWTYHAGNSWGICEDGRGALGCGPQETFRNCADVSIGGSNRTVPSDQIVFPDENGYSIKVLGKNGYEPLVVRSQVCLSRNKSPTKNDDWCMSNCLKYPPNCPEEDCKCLSECHPTAKFATTPEADLHCHANCLRYPQKEQCPKSCTCT